MWVRAKAKKQVTAVAERIEITQSIQKGSNWIAFHEPGINPDLPWRVQHKFLNIRMAEEDFKEMFEDINTQII